MDTNDEAGKTLCCARTAASRKPSELECADDSRPFVVLGAMKISLNGETVDAHGAKTIAELIDRYQLPPQLILVEHNGLALHRHEWPGRPLAEGDRIEFIRVVAGG